MVEFMVRSRGRAPTFERGHVAYYSAMHQQDWLESAMDGEAVWLRALRLRLEVLL